MQPRQPRRNRQQWKSLIEKFHNQNELSRQRFCDAEQLSLGTFQKWLYRFATQEPPTTAPQQQQSIHKTDEAEAAAFGPVMISPSGELPSACCMELPGNVMLHTQSLPSVEYLQNLVKAFGDER